MGDNPTIAFQTTTMVVAYATDFLHILILILYLKLLNHVNTFFDGKSFVGWKRGMMIALTAENKYDFIDESTSEPARHWPTQRLEKIWQYDDLLVQLSQERSQIV